MSSINVDARTALEDKTLMSSNEEVQKGSSLFRTTLRKFYRHKLAMVGTFIFGLLCLMVIFAPLIAPYDPNAIVGTFNAGPSPEHLLGTDQMGRDVLSRLIFASRISLAVGLGSVAIYIIIGTIVGAVAGYFGGWVDMVINRFIDVFMSFPYLMVILVLVTIIGPGLLNIMLVLGILGWPYVARLVRASILSIKEQDYVKAGVALGYRSPRIIFHHILPNTIAPILVNATFGAASAIIAESSLSFLGMGVQPPSASWGNMLTTAQSITALTNQPWLWIPPGIMIVLAVLSINFIGDGVRDALDPKSFK
ncbi:oligopeptide ABC transporter permease [Metabacillus niabensis]|uniref:oligopeptide ABC transporter permease n=1 Tax=Metabacillus niabensis TaxID=324854 RepID=UPI0039A14988